MDPLSNLSTSPIQKIDTSEEKLTASNRKVNNIVHGKRPAKPPQYFTFDLSKISHKPRKKSSTLPFQNNPLKRSEGHFNLALALSQETKNKSNE